MGGSDLRNIEKIQLYWETSKKRKLECPECVDMKNAANAVTGHTKADTPDIPWGYLCNMKACNILHFLYPGLSMEFMLVCRSNTDVDSLPIADTSKVHRMAEVAQSRKCFLL